MRSLGYGIGHKGQTKPIVIPDGVNEDRGLPTGNSVQRARPQVMPPLNVQGREALGNSGNEQGGDSDSSEHSDGESEISELDDEDTDGGF